MVKYLWLCIEHLVAKATPNGCLVSGPGDFQIRMRAGGFSHYIIMIFMYKTFAIRYHYYRLVSAVRALRIPANSN